MDDDALPVRIPLGIKLSTRPTLGAVARRIAACCSVAAGGQEGMKFLSEHDALLDMQIYEIDGELVAERSVPAEVADPELFPARRRRGRTDVALLRATEQRDELQEEVLAAAAKSAETLRRVGEAMNTVSAEHLSESYEGIQRELGASTLPARQFIATKQAAFELEVGEEDSVPFDPPTARTRVAEEHAVRLSVATHTSPHATQLLGIVLDRRAVHGRAAADLSCEAFKLEHIYAFHFEGLSAENLAVLDAAKALNLVVELEARYVVSPATLQSKPAEVLAVENWGELRAAVIQALLASAKLLPNPSRVTGPVEMASVQGVEASGRQQERRPA